MASLQTNNFPPAITLDPVDIEIERLIRDYEHLGGAQVRGRLNHIGNIAKVRAEAARMLAIAQGKLHKYRAKAESMDFDELNAEKHDSERLGRNLIAGGQPKPPGNVDAHAIVSGKHAEAATLKALMAILKIRIDDPDNGMWMPARTADTPHPWFKNCPPHSRIHRHYYYIWINNLLDGQFNAALFRQQLINIRNLLHDGHQPEWVLMKKGEAEKEGLL